MLEVVVKRMQIVMQVSRTALCSMIEMPNLIVIKVEFLLQNPGEFMLGCIKLNCCFFFITN